MTPDLLNAITGALQLESFANPAVRGVGTSTPQQTFQNIFNNAFSSINSSQVPMPYLSNSSYQAASVFKGPRPLGGQQLPIQYQGPQFPQGFVDNSFGSSRRAGRRRGRVIPPGPFRPGAVVINAQDFNVPNQIQNQGPSTAVQALVGAPLQGGVGQSAPQQGGFQGQIPITGYQTNLPPNGLGGGITGILSFVLGPIFGLFGAVKSLLSLRGLRAMQPTEVNREALQYNQYIGYLNGIQEEEGDLDGSSFNYFEEGDSSVVEEFEGVSGEDSESGGNWF